MVEQTPFSDLKWQSVVGTYIAILSNMIQLNISPDHGGYIPIFLCKPQAPMARNLFPEVHTHFLRHRTCSFQSVEDLREKGVEVNFRRALLEQCQESDQLRDGCRMGAGEAPGGLNMVKHAQT